MAGLGFVSLTRGADVRVMTDLAYKTGDGLSDYEKERCTLDLYLPQVASPFPTMVWLYGGGLTAGAKDHAVTKRVARKLAEAGVAVAAVDYRLSPRATFPAYVDDAAAAFAWVRSHIADYGGDVRAVFVGGHSAGGYLTLMVGLDPQYLRRYGLELEAIAGLVPVSAQTMTHYTVRAERGLPQETIIADHAAPIYHVRKDTPPLLVLWADRDTAMRAEENAFLVAALRAAGNENVQHAVMPGRNHNTIVNEIAATDDKLMPEMLSFIRGR